jgi:hypothetical protein
MAKNRSTLAAIRDYLKIVTNRAWDTTKTKYLLQNEIYLGIYQFGEWRNERAFTPIIERELWDAVQEALKETKSRSARCDKADDFVYYLRGRIRCPFCQCVFTQYSVPRTKRVHYYACVLDIKRKTNCPVKRLNADSLHFSVLSLIERAARHHTIMHQLIARSEGWSAATQEQKDLRGVLAKQRAGIQTSIGNIVSAVADGRGRDALMARLDKLERQDREVAAALATVEKQIEAATVERPTAAQVQAAWGSVLEVWPDLSEEEKADLLGALVEDVEVKGKDRVLLRLAPFAEVHGHKLAINSHLGALLYAHENYSDVFLPEIDVLRLSRRTWAPRDNMRRTPMLDVECS